jgi:hypothetical protein
LALSPKGLIRKSGLGDGSSGEMAREPLSNVPNVRFDGLVNREWSQVLLKIIV